MGSGWTSSWFWMLWGTDEVLVGVSIALTHGCSAEGMKLGVDAIIAPNRRCWSGNPVPSRKCWLRSPKPWKEMLVVKPEAPSRKTHNPKRRTLKRDVACQTPNPKSRRWLRNAVR